MIAAVLVVPIAACLFVAAWPQGVGLEQAPVVAQVVAPRVGVIGIALLLLAVFALLAMWRAARGFALTVVALLAAFALVSGGIHLSRGIGATGLEPAAGDITVLSWNTLGDTPGPEALAALIDETGADIVTLPETRGRMAEAAAALLDREFWIASSYNEPGWGALHTSLMIATDMGAYEIDDAGPAQTLPTITARPVSGVGPVILATHPVAPGLPQMHLWRNELAELAAICDAEESAIIAGDFNSTLDHWAAMGEADLGACTDAARAAGAATTGTWPASLPTWLGAQIDHVLVTDRWQVVAAHVVTDRDDAGSDHRPLVAVLRER